MLKPMKKLLTALLALMLLTAMLPAAAQADEATLQLSFIGMYANSDGTFTARRLPGQFEVRVNGVKVGVISSDETGSRPFTLGQTGNVRLIPVMSTIPEDIPVSEQGYAVSVLPGQLNTASVAVQARAGLFTVHAQGKASFTLIDERGEQVLNFETDSWGDYVLPTAIAAGLYTLRMDEALSGNEKWRDKVIKIDPYEGVESILHVDKDYHYFPEIAMTLPMDVGDVMSATAASSAPAEKPTDSLEFPGEWETPISAPTAVPTPVEHIATTPLPNGKLEVAVTGEGIGVSYSVMAGDTTFSEGKLIPGEITEVPGLYTGSYVVTITMPEDVIMTGLNGYPSTQKGSAQWLVSVSAGMTSRYEVELGRAGGISGSIAGVEGGAAVSITGEEQYTIAAGETFRQGGMLPGIYTVAVTLPMGAYEGKGWSFTERSGKIEAVTSAEVKGGSETAIPEIALKATGRASGTVLDMQQQPISGVRVRICDAAGNEIALTMTDSAGRWQVAAMEEGSYTVQYDAGEGVLIPAAAFEIAELSLDAELRAEQAVPASLLVQVFDDDNNNGVWAKNEKYLPGALIQLVTRVDGEDVIAASATTDQDGYARLYAPEGEYILRCEMPENYAYAKKGSKDLITHSAMDQSIERVQELSGVALRSGVEPQIGIGAARMATVCGTVWLDVNCDGLWQSDEPGVEGMRITAEGVRNGLVYETFTDADGKFEINQIRNGTYNVIYYVPDGYVFTIKANGPQQLRSLMTTEADRKGSDQIIFDKGQKVDEQNIGLMQEAIIEGYCFLDANYNGYIDEGEAVLPGVELELLRQSNSKRLQTTVSDATGYFRFGSVRGDTFKIKALLPKDLTYTINVPGDWDANQFAPRDGRREQTITGVEGVSGQTLSIVVGAISYGSVTGVLYEDSNFSGSWETGEKITSGITVSLLNEAGETVKSVKTSKSGSYTFTDLTPGQYQLKLTAKKGYAFTKTGAGSVAVNIGGGEGKSEMFSIALGQDLTGINIGMIVPAVVSGTAFADANDNGLYDPNEKGLVGTRVSLMQADGAVESLIVEPDGSFVFDSVLPGRYYLRYELPENGVFSPRVEGGNAVVGEGSDGAGDWFEVESGETWVAPVCGGLDLGVISGYAFADSNGTGSQDADEKPLPGMTLVLTPSRSDLNPMMVVTGADGAFAFEALRPDRYTLTVTCSDGYVLSRMDDVTLGLMHGLADQTIELTVGMGAAWTEQALGCVLPSSYSGSAWLDENMNGLRDVDERPAAGETLALIDQATGELIANVVTDARGEFTAEGLAPGTYSLSYALAKDVQSSPVGDTTFVTEGDRLIMSNIRIQEGMDIGGALLGLVRETTLSGLVWLDDNGTTVPVEGAEVTLTSADGAETIIVTAGDGRYTFDGLTPGAYRISVVLPEGYAALEPGDRRIANGTLVSILERNEANRGESGTISVRMAEHQLQMDIGSVLPGRLGDFCWLDLNGNGLQDGDEGGIPGVQIALVRNGVVAAETVSDQYGYYVFEALYPGEYMLRVVMPEEVKPTVMRTDLPMIVSVLGENGESVLVPVDSDGVNYDADLGFVLLDEQHYPAGYGQGMTQNWTFEH